MKKNEEVTVTIEDLTYEGLGVGKVDGYPLFIENALIGEEVKVLVMKVGKSFGYAKVVERLTTSPDRVPLTDRVGIRIGTMPLQHMSYNSQLVFKKKQVAQVMKSIAHMPEVPVFDTLGMTNPWGYRNKAQVPVRAIAGELQTGFFRKNSHNMVAVENFHIQDPEIDKAIVAIRDIMREYGVKPYNEKKNIGNLRNIIVRRGYHSGEMMVVLVTRTAKLFPLSKIIPDILEKVPGVVSIIQNVQPFRTNVIMGKETIVLHGEDKFTDQLMGLDFHISSRSFYQVNPVQTEVLYQTAIDAAGLTGEETVIDAYCGIGTLSLALAQNAKEVYAMEIISDAIEMANENKALNNITNAHFKVGAAEEVMPRWKEEGLQADVIVVDPPRKGLEKEFIEAAAAVEPSRIVYVSCNPATMARDLALFAELGYVTKSVQPVDMFPQTTHVESVALLEKA
ncbi:23S rRNA m(5)U-1939 methyltransferase [Granulicatella balaenopterae]|uniref:23S rRNA m(5)U-1939 methyltransferase n=1 Tax=Granulicatella balaenopterae TaxID=137733 RepID=A0A1H9M2Z0_9LACT|nr:23S rRNA (uracil(1939)-C(5))-methyltransferase RlmD [Granulicatella balaenopterae]SER18056.1 23S rRNA m(5)U-1939 methyltransferase [Granulicatella balaenopterae]